MSDLAAYLGAAVLVALAAYMFVLERRGAHRPIRRAAMAFACCEGVSLAVLAPGTVAQLTRAGLDGRVVVAAGDAVRTAAVSVLMILAYALNPHRAPRRRPGAPVAVAVAIQIAMAALFLAARPHFDAAGELTADPPDRWALALRVALFAGYAIWALLEVFRALLPQSRAATTTRALRWGLRTVLAAICVGVVWSLWSYDDFISMLRTGEQDGSEDFVSNALGASCATLVVIGSLLGRSGRTLAATARWLRLLRCYRVLGPLWSAMRTAMPYIAFPQAARPRLAGRLRLEFALYRRVIEIHDGRLVLRPYHHPGIAEWVAEAAVAPVCPHSRSGRSDPGGADDPVTTAALVEAATIATALENMRHDRRFAEAADVPVGDGGLVLTDLDSEVRWLSQVAWAFSRSPVIPVVLERLRAEED